MSLQDFINKYNGQGIDFDGVFGNQCVDLMNQYLVDVCSVTSPIQAFPGSTAYEIYQNANNPQFAKIDNTPDGVPLPGDIVFWNTSIGPAGHVDIFISGDQNRFIGFDQNWPVGSPCHEQPHDYSGVAGWLHPVAQPNPQETMDNLRTARDLNWNLYQQEVAKNTDLTTQLAAASKRGDDLNAQVIQLEKELADANAFSATQAKELQAIKTDDSNLGQRNVDLSKSLSDALKVIQSHWAQVKTIDEESYESTIKSLLAPHQELVKNVVPVMDGLADAAVYTKPPKQQSFLTKYFGWLGF